VLNFGTSEKVRSSGDTTFRAPGRHCCLGVLIGLVIRGLSEQGNGEQRPSRALKIMEEG